LIQHNTKVIYIFKSAQLFCCQLDTIDSYIMWSNLPHHPCWSIFWIDRHITCQCPNTNNHSVEPTPTNSKQLPCAANKLVKNCVVCRMKSWSSIYIHECSHLPLSTMWLKYRVVKTLQQLIHVNYVYI
jgi:hypothetical protein